MTLGSIAQILGDEASRYSPHPSDLSRNCLPCRFCKSLTQPAFLVLYIFIALVVVSVVLSRYLARALRMPDYAWKLGLILFALLASLVVLWRGWPPKTGIDLGGGVILVYQIDTTNLPGGAPDKDLMDRLGSRISERVNPGGQRKSRSGNWGPTKSRSPARAVMKPRPSGSGLSSRSPAR